MRTPQEIQRAALLCFTAKVAMKSVKTSLDCDKEQLMARMAAEALEWALGNENAFAQTVRDMEALVGPVVDDYQSKVKAN